MARPTKQGIDYFPLDCAMDDNVKLIEAEYGSIGFAVLIKIYQKIYGGYGYYCDWTKEVELLFARECGLGGNSVSEIVKALIRRGIFDGLILHKYHVLTSAGVQKRYFEAVIRRKEIFIDPRYLLVPMPLNGINVDNNSVNVDNNPENVDHNSQSKEEESKEEESKVNSFNLESDSRTYLGGIGKDVVLLSDSQIEDLLDKLSMEEFEKYVGIVADAELAGKHYKKKTHYQAILDMAIKDRRI